MKHDEEIMGVYHKLQQESYELVLRNLAIYDWLDRGYKHLQEHPDDDADGLYKKWEGDFTKIYEHLFEMFYRPFKLITFPFSGLGGKGTPVEVFDLWRGALSGYWTKTQPLAIPEEGVGYEPLMEMQLNVSKMMGDWQIGILNSWMSQFSKHLEKTKEEYEIVPEEMLEMDAWLDRFRPIDLYESFVEEKMKSYFAMWKMYLESVSDTQFVFPKEIYTHLLQNLESYPNTYKFWNRYNTMFKSTWDTSLKRLSEQMIEKKNNGDVEYKDFFNAYLSIFNEEYDTLLKSDEFMEVQNGLRNNFLDYFRSTSKVMETLLGMLPALPVALRDEVDGIEKRLHQQRQKTNKLERTLQKILDKLENTPEREEVEKLISNEITKAACDGGG